MSVARTWHVHVSSSSQVMSVAVTGVPYGKKGSEKQVAPHLRIYMYTHTHIHIYIYVYIYYHKIYIIYICMYIYILYHNIHILSMNIYIRIYHRWRRTYAYRPWQACSCGWDQLVSQSLILEMQKQGWSTMWAQSTRTLLTSHLFENNHFHKHWNHQSHFARPSTRQHLWAW